ncbi:MAG: hypothetical protein Satyrvirus6_35 [Satyrvirus sp.]|uniref:Uncharacterized protein n=1 Tax=Satyrvirus sp. TaxID=2487771 RepID=A0A3G5AH57_9VIRU|nr:MAG: hypothetical protein Satyrvirus6_35 [Satyrvirus sp.]
MFYDLIYNIISACIIIFLGLVCSQVYESWSSTNMLDKIPSYTTYPKHMKLLKKYKTDLRSLDDIYSEIITELYIFHKLLKTRIITNLSVLQKYHKRLLYNYTRMLKEFSNLGVEDFLNSTRKTTIKEIIRMYNIATICIDFVNQIGRNNCKNDILNDILTKKTKSNITKQMVETNFKNLLTTFETSADILSKIVTNDEKFDKIISVWRNNLMNCYDDALLLRCFLDS